MLKLTATNAQVFQHSAFLAPRKTSIVLLGLFRRVNHSASSIQRLHEEPPNFVCPAAPVAESLSSGVWDEKYGQSYGELEFASVLEQGNREDMQDFLHVVPKARCGFLYAGDHRVDIEPAKYVLWQQAKFLGLKRFITWHAGVFDGHGGETAAQYLSKELYEAFSDNLSEESYDQQNSAEERGTGELCCPVELSSILKSAFLKMDNELLKWLGETQDGEEALSGSTATVVLARNDKIVVANVGDSRAVLCREGQAKDLSTEHRVMGKGRTVEEEIARVKSIGGWISDGRVCDVLAVSRAFGDPQFKGKGLPDLLSYGVKSQFWDAKFAESIHFTGDPVIATPDVTEISLNMNDEFIILASDGLWDVMSSKEAIDFARKDLQKGRPLQSIADKLANIAKRRYSQDNIAVVLIDLGGNKEGWGKQKTMWTIFGA